MATSALIVLDDDAPAARVFGLDPIEYVIRRIAAAGVGHVVVVVDRVPATLGVALDRLRADAIRCSVAHAAADLADLFHPDEYVALIGTSMLADAELLTELARADEEYLLCTRDDAAHAPARGAERIDATMWWTGHACLRGRRVGGVAAAPFDWNVASTLLRAAVQEQVARRLAATDAVRDANDAAAVAAYATSATRGSASPSDGGWGSRFVVEPLARLASRLGAHRLAVAVRHGPPLAAALSLGAVGAVFTSFDRRSAVAATCVLLAVVALAVGRIGCTVTALPNRFGALARRLVAGSAGVALIAHAWPGEPATFVVAIAVVALTWLFRRGTVALPPPHWSVDLPGQALLIGLATAAAPTLFGPALAVGVVHAFVCLAWSQDRVSELLTSRR